MLSSVSLISCKSFDCSCNTELSNTAQVAINCQNNCPAPPCPYLKLRFTDHHGKDWPHFALIWCTWTFSVWFTMSILHSTARPSGASRRSSEVVARSIIGCAARPSSASRYNHVTSNKLLEVGNKCALRPKIVIFILYFVRCFVFLCTTYSFTNSKQI